jgi:hypothetical protein
MLSILKDEITPLLEDGGDALRFCFNETRKATLRKNAYPLTGSEDFTHPIHIHNLMEQEIVDFIDQTDEALQSNPDITQFLKAEIRRLTSETAKLKQQKVYAEGTMKSMVATATMTSQAILDLADHNTTSLNGQRAKI